ncbi:MAG: hypothetical protein EPN20_12970 [Magnetospirillum sp.]|nr:MAG: hypothetical protein EPN20_12970 [Magnetospirillum sp.]
MLRSRLHLAAGLPLVPECPRSGPAVATDTFINILTSLSLTANLKACFDAGDAASYGGSGTTVNDRSGTGVNLGFVGSPSFAGVAGAKDGTDYFDLGASDKLQLASMPAWSNVGTKGASFTLAAWVLPRQSGAVLGLMQDYTNGSSCASFNEFNAYNPGGGALGPALAFAGCYGACSSIMNYGIQTAGQPVSTLTWGCWSFVALSVAEGVANGSFFYANGSYAPVNLQYTPGTSTGVGITPTNTVTLSYQTSTTPQVANFIIGCADASARKARVGGLLHWQAASTSGGNLSKAQLDSIFAATKARYGF